MDGQTPIIDLTENWKVSLINGGKSFKVAAPQLAWGPFVVGDILIFKRVHGSSTKIMIHMAKAGDNGVKLTQPLGSGFCTLQQSTKKIGFTVDAAKLVNPHRVNQNCVSRNETQIVLDLGEFNLREYEVSEPKTKTKAPALPFKFDGNIVGVVPKAIAVLNQAVDDELIQLEIVKSGNIRALVTIVIDGK